MEFTEVLNGALKAIMLLALPLAVVSVVASVLVSALQTATNIHEPASSYVARLIAVIVTVGLLFQAEVTALSDLLDLALR